MALPVLLLVWMFWSANRRQKTQRRFNASIEVGDRIVTSSGVYGTIKHLDDESAYLEVADGVLIRFDRRAVALKQSDGVSSPVRDTATPETEQ